MRQIVIDKSNREGAILKKRVSTANQEAAKKAYDPIVVRAIEVIGNEAAALRWLETPVRALDYATPISLLDTKDGKDKVLAVLDQLEYGVF